MNETERRLRWREVQRELRMLGDGWPEELTSTEGQVIRWLGILHSYPKPGAKWPEFQAGCRSFEYLIDADIKTGRFPVTRETRTITQKVHVRDEVYYPVPRDGGRLSDPLSRADWHSSFIESHQRQHSKRPVYEAQEVQQEVLTVRATDVARYMDEMETGRYMAAWLAPYRMKDEVAAPKQNAPVSEASKVPQEPQRVMRKDDILRELEREFPHLQNAWERGTKKPSWIDDAKVKHGRYNVEKIRQGCNVEWPKTACVQQSQAALSMLAQAIGASR